MSRISTYPIQSIVIGTDKVIGSGLDMATKNFTFDDVSAFLNGNNKIEVNALRYEFQNWKTGQLRKSGSISFTQSGIGQPAFSSITSFVLSRNMQNSKIDVSSYYFVPLVGSSVLISQVDDPAKFGIYTWVSRSQRDPEINFYDIDLTFIAGNGNLNEDKDYFISLLTYGALAGDKNYVFSQDVALNPWVVTHGLNKYPSVSVVSSSNEVVYGDVQYDNLNQVTITFNGAQTGKAYFN
jgi:hypothetical protein|tara:strand:+ start:723 stop:1436 length:714 start_codon:yes stop_codon:yes gene_type:complete